MLILTLPVAINPDKQTDLHLVAQEEDSTLVGLAIVVFGKGENVGWISDVYVRPDSQRKGYGRRLLDMAIAACRANNRAFASLSVANDNEPAKALYSSLGFLPFMDGKEGHTQYILTL